MRGKKNVPTAVAARLIALAMLLFAVSPPLSAQAPHYLGTVTAIGGNTLTVKTDSGEIRQVDVPSTAQLKRIEPGETDLRKAENIEFSSLASGDRVLVTVDPNSTGSTPQAARVIAIKQADVEKKQQVETAQWNQGVHGLVKSVDPSAGVIVVNDRQGLATNAVTVNTNKATTLKRYAPGSVRFDQAQPAPISAIRPGDQLWSRGSKSADGSSIDAESVVFGSFLSIPATILSTDSAASTIAVKDLATKKTVTVHIPSDAQLRRLDGRIATFIAMRLNGNQNDGNQSGNQSSPGAHPAATGLGAGAGSPGGQRSFPQGGGAPGGGDLEGILQRAQRIQLAELEKGEAVMIVATEDNSGANAIKVLAGVEPLLEAPAAQDLLASWSLNNAAPDTGQ